MVKAGKRLGEFGKRIATLRAKNALTASDLARLMNVTPAAVWQWEKNGARPRQDAIEKIASHFRVPISELTGEQSRIESSVVSVGEGVQLGGYSLEELLKAIERRGFEVMLQRKNS